jgi:5-methylcytosine-specific restriction endonuclease McrA
MALVDAVQGRFTVYNDSKGELSVMVQQSYNQVKREDLEHCYTVMTNPLNALLRDIKIGQPEPMRFKCQYCNINSPASIDHYLPKSKFPEFSIFPLNLLPCCGECNRIKADAFLKDGERQIINFYFDPLPSERYLNVRINYLDDMPIAEYYLKRNSGITEKMFSLIKAHYGRLNLFQRLQESSVETFSETRASMLNKQITSIETVKALLLEKAQFLSVYNSSNYWQAVLYEAVADETEFLRSCVLS